MSDSTLSLIVPTYNEKDNIDPLIQRVARALDGRKYEIVIVDDNSRDGTADAASALSAKYPVRVIVRRNERGLASAVVHGFNNTQADIIGVMDADLQHPPEVVAELVKAIDAGADLAIASRYVKGGGCEGWSLTRRVISKGAIFLAHLFLPRTRGIGDPMAGFFMLRRPVVTGADLRPTGYKILLEILIAGHARKVTEVPYTFKVREKGESKLSSKTQIDYLRHLFSLMRRSGELVRFIKFAVVGGSGFFVNMGVYWIFTRPVPVDIYVAKVISFEASVISNFVLNNFFTFSDRRTSRLSVLLRQLVKFNLISIGALGIQEGSLWLFHTVVGLYDILAVGIGIILGVTWNYLPNNWWTWK